MTIALCTAGPRAFPAIKNALWVTSLLVALPTVAFSASLAPIAAEHGMVVTAQHLATCRNGAR